MKRLYITLLFSTIILLSSKSYAQSRKEPEIKTPQEIETEKTIASLKKQVAELNKQAVQMKQIRIERNQYANHNTILRSEAKILQQKNAELVDENKKLNKQLLLIVIPLLAYLLLWAAKSCPMESLQSKSFGDIFAQWGDQFRANWSVFQLYLPFIGLCWVLFQFGQGLAGRTLTIFSLTVVALLLTAILVGGKLAMWCVVAIGLFTSIGWSNTFSLALEGTGNLKSQVSSLLVMAILGGAILPPLQGFIADETKNLQLSFIVPLIAYAYVAFYGAVGHRMGRLNDNPAR